MNQVIRTLLLLAASFIITNEPSGVAAMIPIEAESCCCRFRVEGNPKPFTLSPFMWVFQASEVPVESPYDGGDPSLGANHDGAETFR